LISGPGLYDLTGASVLFSSPTALAIENSFDAISLSISTNGAFYDLSLLACLTTGGGCLFGNQLTANFEVPSASLNGQNVAVTGLDQPHPLDLLEDDGTTDIHGSITSFTGTASAVPEPATALCSGVVLVAMLARRLCRRREERNT